MVSTSKPGKKVKYSIKTLGKSEARDKFLPLVDAVAAGAGPVEITDYGKVVAVIISKVEFDCMSSRLNGKPARTLCGLGVLAGDLQEGSLEIASRFRASVGKAASEL